MRSRIAMAGATLATVAVGAGVLGLTTAGATADPLVHVEQYLYGQVQSDGSLAGAVGATEDTVIGTADAGYNPATLVASNGTSALDYLGAQTTAGKTTDTAGHTAKLLLAVVAAHQDPTAFHGHNLVATLTGFAQSDGTYHSTAVDSSSNPVETPNIFSQSLAVLALKAAGQTVPAKALTVLTCAQEADGSWGYAITPPGTSTAAPACADSNGGDTNSTAIALQALNAGGTTSANSAALTYLHKQQESGGGFDFGFGPPADPDSTSTVVQAVVAAGQDPASATWTPAGGTTSAYGALVAMQDSATGGYTYPGRSAPDAFTTSEVPAALAKAPYGKATTFRAAAPPPSSTTTATTTSVVTSTVTTNGTVSTVTATTTAGGGILGVPTTGAGPSVPTTGVMPAPFAALLLVAGGVGLVASAAGLRPRNGAR